MVASAPPVAPLAVLVVVVADVLVGASTWGVAVDDSGAVGGADEGRGI